MPSGHCTLLPEPDSSMKLHLLETAIDQYLSKQWINDSTDWYYLHSMVNEFHTNWRTPDQHTLKEVYDQSLKSEFSQRWWKRDGYRPKEIMLHLIDADPELAAIAWKDLSNDKATLDGRLSRFEYYCSELLQIHRQKNIRSVESYHHQDASIMSLYLSGLFPEQYALYPGLDTFQSFCRAIGSPDIPVIDDLVRYMKVASIVFTFLKKNAQYPKLIALRDPTFHKIPFIPFLTSCEIITFEGERFKKQFV
jgi:hypothetical protein